MFCWWPLHPGRFPPQLCFAVWFVLNFYVTPSRCCFHPLLKPHSHRLGLLAYVISCFCAPTASAEDKRLYTDAIVTYELMHIGHGVDSERLDLVFPPACAFNAAASFLFAKVRQSEMTFFIHDPHVNKTVWPAGPTADITTSVLLFSLQHPWKKTLPYCM